MLSKISCLVMISTGESLMEINLYRPLNVNNIITLFYSKLVPHFVKTIHTMVLDIALHDFQVFKCPFSVEGRSVENKLLCVTIWLVYRFIILVLCATFCQNLSTFVLLESVFIICGTCIAYRCQSCKCIVLQDESGWN